MELFTRTKWPIMGCVCLFKVVSLLTLTLLLFCLDFTHAKKKETICGKIELQGKEPLFQHLENCTVIEGALIINRIQTTDQEAFEKLSFPDLVEITEYLLIYRVHRLKTLRNLFPNLAVIRGDASVHDYSLIMYELPHLSELGLPKLKTILKGAVRFERDPNLCFVETIDWGQITRKGTINMINLMTPKPECFDICPGNCNMTVWPKHTQAQKRCWTVNDCQILNNSTCDTSRPHCPSMMCSDDGECCDSFCLGGCYGPGSDQCYACAGVRFNDHCLPTCPPKTYRFKERRCIRESECKNEALCTGVKYLLQNDSVTGEGACKEGCPPNYMEEESNPGKCSPCKGPCPVVCNPIHIDSIAHARRIKGCTIIKGDLIITITVGSNESISLELEKSLSSITEVDGYIAITSSYPLVSLDFLRNIKVIHGNSLKTNAALFVYKNPNLRTIFTDPNHTLSITNGIVLFDYNRKLCASVISNFVDHVTFNRSSREESDGSKNNNGDQAQCNITNLKWLMIAPYSGTACVLQWESFRQGDNRNLISYMIYYREVPSRESTLTINEGSDACNSKWITREVAKKKNVASHKTLIHPLQPYTMYAVYVETTMLSSSVLGGRTTLNVFRTKPTDPTEPVDLKVTEFGQNNLTISWKPPLHPNGEIEYYEIFWNKRQIQHKTWYASVDFCNDALRRELSKKLSRHINNRVKKEEEESNKTEQCCSCKTGQPKVVIDKDEQRREDSKYFENRLQGVVYTKSPINDDKKKRKKSAKDIETEKFCRKMQSLDPFKRKNINTSSMTPLKARKKRRAVSDKLLGKLDEFANLKDDRKTNASEPRNTTSDKSTSTTTPTANENEENDTLFEPPSDTEMLNKVVVYGKHLNSWTLANLKHFTDYTIQVRACQKFDEHTKISLCGEQDFVTVRTDPNTDKDKIDESTIRIEATANDTRMVTWDAPADPNGMVLYYDVLFNKTVTMKNDKEKQKKCVSEKTRKKDGGVSIPGTLSPGNYSVQIQAFTLAESGPSTNPHYFLVHEIQTGFNMDLVIGLVMCAIILVIFGFIVVMWRCAKHKTALERIISSYNPEYPFFGPEGYVADEWEVSRDDIELLKELGAGSFGMVYEGKYRVNENEALSVAVKTLNDSANLISRANFLREASNMKQFHCHHVVKLKGVVSQTQPTYVIMELMGNGDLKNFLRGHRPDEADPSIYPKEKISCRQVLKMAGEIADGMAYLASKKFVHRDLAARNCMVGDDWVVKIGDFGMTRDIYETDYYRKGGKDLLPVRWMAPESLKDGVYDSKSDVWSFGVVLWEMATLAAQPYQGLGNEQVLKYVINGDVMECPENCPDKLFDLMRMCWQYRAHKRPTFCQIIEMLIVDLPPAFNDVSFFFSNENKDDGGEFFDNKIDNFDDSNVNATSLHESDIELDQISIVTGTRRQDLSDYSGGSECAVLQHSDVTNSRDSVPLDSQSIVAELTSPPPIQNNSTDESSKDSSKSSNNSYALPLRNGLINGHVPAFHQTSNC